VTVARRRNFSIEITLLAIGSALGLAAIDVIYVLSGTISPIYLADAAAEIGLAGGWAFARARVSEHGS
jgi:hypothetical protein